MSLHVISCIISDMAESHLISVKKLARNLCSCIFYSTSHLLFPSFCQCCRGVLEHPSDVLCKKCSESFQSSVITDFCPCCGSRVSVYGLVDNKCPACAGEDMPFDGIALCAEYSDCIRDLILKFKYSDSVELAGVFGKMLNAAFQVSPFYEDIDVIVPVPLHWIRRLQRGYNQSLLLAKRLKHPSARVSTDLVRIRNTSRQFNLSHPQRKKNVKGAFALRKEHNFSGKNICLVDDIITTGATVRECAKTLKAESVGKVYLLLLASAYSS